MLEYVALGASFGFGAAVQPGPFQAYLVSETMNGGWRRTAPAVLAPLLSDIPIIAIVLVLLVRLPPGFIRLLQLLGGAFLLYLAAGAARSAVRYRPSTATSAAHVTFFKAVLINLLNPNPYLGWGLVLGPLVLHAWRHAPSSGIGLIAAFYAALVLGTAGIVAVLALAQALGPRVARALVALSALGLAAFGFYDLWLGLGRPGSAPN